MEKKTTSKEKDGNVAQEPIKVSIQQVLDTYPVDREKIRDHFLLTIVNELNRIATTLDWFAKRKQEEIDKNIKLKD